MACFALLSRHCKLYILAFASFVFLLMQLHASQAQTNFQIQKSEKPMKWNGPVKGEGELTIGVNLPLKKVETIANQFRYKFDISRAVVFNTIKYFRGKVTVSQIRLTSADDQKTIKVQAKFRLDGSAIGTKIRDATGTADFDVQIDIGPNWCPIIKFRNTDIAFDRNARNRIARYGMAFKQLSDKVSDWLTGFTFEEILKCDELKKKLQALWVPSHSTAEVAKATHLHFYVVPSRIKISEIVVVDNTLKLMVSFSAQTRLSTRQLKFKRQEIPDPERTKLDPVMAKNMEFESRLTGSIGLVLP